MEKSVIDPKALAPKRADKYILRFERPGHRDEIKARAAIERRTLNKQILHLIEAGEKATQQPQEVGS